jgi:hypothetical protein
MRVRRSVVAAAGTAYVLVGSALMAPLAFAAPIASGSTLRSAGPEATLTAEIDDPEADEFSVDGAPGLIVWSQGVGDTSDAYLRVGTGEPVQLDPPDTGVSFVATDGTTIALSEVGADGSLDLALIDVATLTPLPVPDGINTPRHEDWPSIDGDRLFFVRTPARGDSAAPGRVRGILFDLQTGEKRVLANLPARDSQLFVGQLEGDFAAWSTCYTDFATFTVNDCQVFRYQISTGETVQVPNPHKLQFAPLVTDDGTVYFSRNRANSAWRCGEAVKVMRYRVGGRVEEIATVPEGYGAFWGHAVVESDGSTTLHVYRPSCDTFTGGIYRLDDADTI